MKIAAVEAGGTKFVCGLVDEKGHVLERVTIPTTTPDETMDKVFDYFNKKSFSCMGIGSFGPIDLDLNSLTFGYIKSTPKEKWINYNLLGTFKSKYDIPIGIDTDVNAAALGEIMFGSAVGLDSCVYLTVGTGIGGGAIVNGKSIKGLMHPEMGHISLKRHPDDNYQGTCPYHGDCFEGLAAGPAIEKRFGKPGVELSDNLKVWEMESYYLAQGIMSYVLTISPEKVILGGGVMHQEGLHQLVHKNLIKLLNGYINNDKLMKEDFICKPKLKDNAGLIGSAMLGLKEFEKTNKYN